MMQRALNLTLGKKLTFFFYSQPGFFPLNPNAMSFVPNYNKVIDVKAYTIILQSLLKLTVIAIHFILPTHFYAFFYQYFYM